MNHYGIHHQFASSCEEMRSCVPMVCPKPRRLSLFSNEPLRWQMCHQSEGYDSKTGPELLDIIFSKSCTSSPPFFSGSPPSRVSNPLIQDARFGDDKNNISPRSSSSSPSPSPSSSARCNFGNKPAVRIEGFDCLDRRNCSIPTLA